MDEVDEMVVAVRADTGAFRRDVAALRAELGGPLVVEADRAGRAIAAPFVHLRSGTPREDHPEGMVEPRGVEPLTSSLRTRRSTN